MHLLVSRATFRAEILHIKVPMTRKFFLLNDFAYHM